VVPEDLAVPAGSSVAASPMVPEDLAVPAGSGVAARQSRGP
jgi:hypothetical protein